MSRVRRSVAALAALALCGLGVAGASAGAGASSGASWPYPNGNLANTRVAVGSGITAANVARLRKAWSFPITGKAAVSLDDTGSLVANPIVVGGVVYLQDMYSNVYAISLATGKKVWEHYVGLKLLSGPGPNGVAVSGGLVYAMSPRDAFALHASDGSVAWSDPHLLAKGEGTFGIQPQVAGGREYLASQYGVKGGMLFALNAANGHELWRFDTVKTPDPAVTSLGLGSGGAWETPLVGADGSVTFGTGNPYQTFTSAMTAPEAQAYTDSEVNLNAATGALRWTYQAVPDDFKDWDMQASPIATTVRGAPAVIGAGKMGDVYAMNARTGALLWKTPVGEHNGHDDDSLNALEHHRAVKLPFDYLPGSLGGVLANMSVAGGTVYVETLDLELRYSKGSQVTGAAYKGTKEAGEIEALSLATGKVEWDTRVTALPLGDMTVVNDLVLTTYYGGSLVALSRATGKVVAKIAVPAATNAGLAVAGDTVVVPAGAPRTVKGGGTPQVVAYRLG